MSYLDLLRWRRPSWILTLALGCVLAGGVSLAAPAGPESSEDPSARSEAPQVSELVRAARETEKRRGQTEVRLFTNRDLERLFGSARRAEETSRAEATKPAGAKPGGLRGGSAGVAPKPGEASKGGPPARRPGRGAAGCSPRQAEEPGGSAAGRGEPFLGPAQAQRGGAGIPADLRRNGRGALGSDPAARRRSSPAGDRGPGQAGASPTGIAV